MLGPNQHTHHVASQQYAERLSHAARIRMIQKERSETEGTPFFNLDAHRLITARRLAAGLAGVVLAAAVAAGSAGVVNASPSHAAGGGATLVR